MVVSTWRSDGRIRELEKSTRSRTCMAIMPSRKCVHGPYPGTVVSRSTGTDG